MNHRNECDAPSAGDWNQSAQAIQERATSDAAVAAKAMHARSFEAAGMGTKASEPPMLVEYLLIGAIQEHTRCIREIEALLALLPRDFERTSPMAASALRRLIAK